MTVTGEATADQRSPVSHRRQNLRAMPGGAHLNEHDMRLGRETANSACYDTNH
jgi:hypothetical protein